MADSSPLPPRRVIYRGRKLDLALQPVRLADGTLADREVVVHRGAVAMVPLLDDGRVVLVRNFRHTVGQTLLEVPAGTLDPGESPDATAPRELREETGYTAGTVRFLGSWWVSPGILNERMYLYLCTDLTPGATEHQPDEQLEPVAVDLDAALAMIADGRIDDAKTIIALLRVDGLRRQGHGGRLA